MSHVRFSIDGLDELKAALRRLPEELAGEGGHLVEAAGNGAGLTVRTEYGKHRRSGSLQNRVTVEHHASRFGAVSTVTSADPIAWLFDNGSQARHWAGGKSTGTMWGQTPPTHVFARTMARARRDLQAQLRALLERHGLTVTGDA